MIRDLFDPTAPDLTWRPPSPRVRILGGVGGGARRVVDLERVNPESIRCGDGVTRRAADIDQANPESTSADMINF